MKKRFLCVLLTLCMASSLLPAVALADDPVIDTEAELNAAILAVAENGTVTLGGNITLADTLSIGGTKSFTIDLNGFALDFDASDKDHGLIYFTGTGTLTITDSSAGGKLQANFNSTVESNGSGKLIISGNASIISTESVAIYITGGTAGSDVLEISGDAVVNGAEYTRAIYNVGDGDVTVAGGEMTAGIGIDSSAGNGNVTVSGGTVRGLFQGIWAKGNVILTGGTLEGAMKAIDCIDPGQIIISGGTVVLKSDGGTTSKAPDLTGYTSYYWRTSSDVPFIISTTEAYTYNASHTYVEFAPYVVPTTYTVTLPSGTGYTVFAQDGSSSPVTSGGNFSFTVAIASGYHKAADFAVKSNGTTLTANGSGVYTISGITQNQTVTVEGVVQDTPAPDSGYAPPADTIVYNNPSKPNATIWLSGSGLNGNDLLVTQTLTGGSSYNAMRKLADRKDIFCVYDISLKSGKAATGSAMHLTFDLTEQYAGQAFTLVQKKANGAFEYLYATAGADGNVTFGTIDELSLFMLVKGQLTASGSVSVPNTGGNSTLLPGALMVFAIACSIGVAVYRKKRTQA